MNIPSLKPVFKAKATSTPAVRPGIENNKLYIEIIESRCVFLKPRDLSIPYSYVLLSTSESISEYRSIADSIDRNTMIEISVESRNVFIVLVVPN
jgi:hypothetical protein